MKKGFTMIELIFVIVILGILASVAIPRLSSTRLDAEISATVANLRTLQSDLSAYFTVTGSFAGVKMSEMTNVQFSADYAEYDGPAHLKVGGDDKCFIITTYDMQQTDSHFMPAAIMIEPNESTADAICKDVQNAEPVKKFTEAEIYEERFTTDVDGNKVNVSKELKGHGIVIGSSVTVY